MAAPAGAQAFFEDPGSGSDSLLDLLEEADTLFLSREYERALQVIDRACALDPASERGRALQGRIREAAQALALALERGKACLASGRPGQAIGHFRRAHSLQPQNDAIGTSIEEARRRFVSERRGAARDLARRKRHRAAARAASAALHESGDEADRHRLARCLAASRARRRLRLAWSVPVLASLPLLAVAAFQGAKALALAASLSRIRDGGPGALAALHSPATLRSMDVEAHRRAIEFLSAARVHQDLAEGRFADAARATGPADVVGADRSAARHLQEAQEHLAAGRFDEACARVESASREGRSEAARAACRRLLVSIRARMLEEGVALEREGRFAEEADLLSALAGGPAALPGGEEEVRLDLCRAVQRCAGLAAEAGGNLERCLAVDQEVRQLLRHAELVAPILRAHGGDGFSAAVSHLAGAATARLLEAASRRALEVHHLSGRGPRLEADRAAIVLLESIDEVRRRLDPERYQALAASLTTILR